MLYAALLSPVVVPSPPPVVGETCAAAAAAASASAAAGRRGSGSGCGCDCGCAAIVTLLLPPTSSLSL